MKWQLARDAEKPEAEKTKRLTGLMLCKAAQIKAVFCAAAAGVQKGLGAAALGTKRFVLRGLNSQRFRIFLSRLWAWLTAELKSIKQWAHWSMSSAGILSKRIGRSINTLLHIHHNKPDAAQAPELTAHPLHKLRSTTKQLTQTLRERYCGKGPFIAKLALSATTALMGIILLLVMVYSVIPSAIADTAHLFEHDIATEMYRRTLKDADMPAFRQTMVRQDISFPRDCFASVLKDNPDIEGLITISGMGLGYLVTQYTDNTFYTDTGYNRRDSDSGTLILDYRCNADILIPQSHYIVYGKNLSGGTMFGRLWYFRDEKFFYANPLIRFDTLYDDYEWEVFSVHVAKPDFYFEDTVFSSDLEWLEFLKLLKSSSLYDTDVKLSRDDALLTLYTDSDDFPGARLVVHARLIK